MIHNISMKQQAYNHSRQAGVVSIIVATMLIIIVGLIVVAFTQVSRREQRESLDDQLSTQAYYAAETGVNAVRSNIQAKLQTGGTPSVKKVCPQDANYNFPYVVSSQSNVTITCLLVDPNPTVLPYTLSMTNGTVLPVHSEDNKPINTLTIAWNPSSSTGTLAQCPSVASVSGASGFVTAPNWKCAFGVVRADLVDVDGGYSRDALLNNDKVSFMVPVASGGSGTIDWSTATPQTLAAATATCSASECSVTFKNIGATTMYLRLSSIYLDNVPVKIHGTYADNSAFKFSGALAVIDSTARAQDVVRRIVVSAPLTDFDGTNPIQALISGQSVCKRFRVAPDYQNMATQVSGATGC